SKLRQGFWMVFRFGVNNWGSLFYKNQQARMLYSMGFLRKVVFLSLKIILCLQVPNGPFFGIIFYNENDW
ncbi:hypothetical protein, partial [Streptococcus pneumoniae]|uniref:hypothetical protein n=1 Tax=Streptococcus pneumoniae TaxID=1313 RepID=UPI0006C8993E